jgi:hypothetical protein
MLVLSFPPRPGQWAMMVTNPSPEAIPLGRTADGWRPSLEVHTAAGLGADQLRIGDPIPEPRP